MQMKIKKSKLRKIIRQNIESVSKQQAKAITREQFLDDKNKANKKHWQSRVQVYDLGEQFYDRYSVIIDKRHIYSMSDNPRSPVGINVFNKSVYTQEEYKEVKKALGKKITKLSEQLQKAISERVHTFAPNARDRYQQKQQKPLQIKQSKKRKLKQRSLNFSQVGKQLDSLGIKITKQDDWYRVNFKNGKQATAYYTDDLQDALETGKAMVKKQKCNIKQQQGELSQEQQEQIKEDITMQLNKWEQVITQVDKLTTQLQPYLQKFAQLGKLQAKQKRLFKKIQQMCNNLNVTNLQIKQYIITLVKDKKYKKITPSYKQMWQTAISMALASGRKELAELLTSIFDDHVDAKKKATWLFAQIDKKTESIFDDIVRIVNKIIRPFVNLFKGFQKLEPVMDTVKSEFQKLVNIPTQSKKFNESQFRSYIRKTILDNIKKVKKLKQSSDIELFVFKANDDKWYAEVQRNDEILTYGRFSSEKQAVNRVSTIFGNPGDYMTDQTGSRKPPSNFQRP